MIRHFILLALLASVGSSAQEDPNSSDWRVPRLKALLKDLSEFARNIDTGVRTLERAHQREGQPDGMMTELRALVHEYPDLGSVVSAYFRSKEEPLMARALAVLALAQPRSREVAGVMGELFAEPPDMKLAILAGLGYAWGPDVKGDPGWSSALALISLVDGSASWRTWRPNQHRGAFLRSESESPLEVDMRPMLEGLVRLAGRDRIGELKTISLSLVLRLSQRRECTEELRRQTRECIRHSYLHRDDGWSFAMDHLTGSPGSREKPDLETLGRGFPGLDVRRKLQVLDGIARHSREAVFEPPFDEDFDKVLEVLGLPPKESGLELGVMFYYVLALKTRLGVYAPLKKRLLESAPKMLRQRLLLDE